MRTKIFRIVSLVAVLALMLAAFGLGFGIGGQTRIVFRTPPPAIPTSAPPPTAVPPPTMEALRAQVNDISEDAKRIDKIVTLLLGLASFYAIALGLNSYFGLKQILETADKDSKAAVARTVSDSRRVLAKVAADTRAAITSARGESKRVLNDVTTDSQRTLANAKADFDRFREEIRQNYPEIANLHDNLRGQVLSLALFQERSNWSDYTWAKLSDRQREDTHMAEFWFAGLEVFALARLSAYAAEVTGICLGFGRFYSSRFKKTKLRADWERASIYFEKAVRNPEPKAALLKDHGVHLTLIEVGRLSEIETLGGIEHLPPAEFLELKDLRTQAESSFVACLGLNPAEPGALFGLGWLYFRKREFPAAIARYTAITDAASTLTAADRKKYLADAYQNRANAVWFDSKDLGRAYQDLDESKKIATQYNVLDVWKSDLDSDPDYKTLWAADATRKQALFA